MSDDRKEKLEKLKVIQELILKHIQEYNELASDVNFDARIGLVTGQFYADDETDGGVNWDQHVEDYYDGGPSWHVQAPGTSHGWMPSGLNC